MFIKAFRIKSQTQVKSSERKKLKSEVLNAYPQLTDENVSELLPTKCDLNVAKVYCHKGESVLLYLVDKQPLFFSNEKERKILPTVYTLWKFPNILQSFITHPPVIGNLAKGADLMIPGIVVQSEVGPDMYGKFERGHPVSVATTDNKTPVAVGVTAHDSLDMYMCGRYGKGLVILHVFGDFLWQLGSKIKPTIIYNELCSLDKNCTADEIQAAMDSMKITEEIQDNFGDDCKAIKEEINELGDCANTQEDCSGLVPTEPQTAERTFSKSEEMDDLLLHCLIKAIKTSLGKATLPLLTSHLYAQHMLAAVPDGRRIEIKASSYKKLSKFLSSMTELGLITVKEYPKGIENLHAINFTHSLIKTFIVDKSETTIKTVVSNSPSFTPPLIEELFCVSGQTVEFFRKNMQSKGDVLSAGEIRIIVTNYIKEKNLSSQKKSYKDKWFNLLACDAQTALSCHFSSKVELDPLLHATVVSPKEGLVHYMRWDEIFSRVLGKMSQAVRITRPGEPPIVRKGKLEPLQIEIAKRTGNKKVTLIYNAATYGIDENEFAHQIQIGVGASTSVGMAENKAHGTTQVLVQGNQVTFVAKLLLDDYNIAKKYIRGLELANKDKKKKQ